MDEDMLMTPSSFQSSFQTGQPISSQDLPTAPSLASRGGLGPGAGALTNVPGSTVGMDDVVGGRHFGGHPSPSSLERAAAAGEFSHILSDYVQHNVRCGSHCIICEESPLRLLSNETVIAGL